MFIVQQMLDHRGLIWKRALSELKFRYTGTVVGSLWAVLHPLSLIAVYTFVFGTLLGRDDSNRFGVPFPLFLCAGLLPWIMLTECVTRCCSAFKSNRAYLKKLPVPESVYMGQAAVSATINGLISISILLIGALVIGVGPYPTWLLLPIPIAALAVIGLGFGMAMGTINLFIPDVGEFVPVMLRIGMWLVPVIIPMVSYETYGVGGIVAALPPTQPLNAIRQLMLGGEIPTISTFAIMTGWSLAACFFGTTVLRKLRDEIKDVL